KDAAIWFNRGGTDITLSQNVMDGASMTAGSQIVFLNSGQVLSGLRVLSNWIKNGGTRAGLFVDSNRTVNTSATRTPQINQNLFDADNVGINMGIRSFDGGEVSGNTFSNNVFDGLQGGPKNSRNSGNSFINNGRHGLALTAFGTTSDATRGAQLNTITCNTITGNGFANAGSGISFSATQAAGTISSNHVNFNNISGNNIGASYSGTENIDAENNWWGSATGPTIASNPGGTGDTISDPNGGIDYSPFLTSTAACANSVVSPANQQGWLAQVTSPDGLAQFVTSPPVPLFGTGSRRLFTGTHGDESAQFRNSNYDGTSLATLTGLGYCTYVTQWNGQQTPYIILNVDRDNNGTVDDLLFFEPSYSNGTFNPAIPTQP